MFYFSIFRILEPNLNLNEELADQLTHEELTRAALAEEAHEMFNSNRLNTESVQKMADANGWMTVELAEFFCSILNEQNPNTLNLHLNQGFATPANRKLHAQELNVAKYSQINFIFSRSGTELFDQNSVNLNHFAVASILESGLVIFIDSLYKNIPENLMSVIGDYYRHKYGRGIKEIVNLSGQKNCPTQRDGNLCGFIAMMLMTALHNKLLTKMLLDRRNRWLMQNYADLIFHPSSYNQ